MKRVFGKIEAGFDIVYLAIAALIAFMMWNKGEIISLYIGVMAFTLVVGDAFHLIPRIFVIFTCNESKYRSYLGRGKQITSITMTIFYVILWLLLKKINMDNTINTFDIIILILTLVRITLCLLPYNQWTERYPPVLWGVIRNIPFFLIGMISAIAYYQQSFMNELSFIWLAITLSFLFYLPVVLWANKNAKIGMLMLPKTCCYIWMLLMFASAF